MDGLIIGFAIMLGITFEIYISKKDLFRDIDVQTENVSKKIRKCTYFFIFLFFYLPLSTYISWPIIRQL